MMRLTPDEIRGVLREVVASPGIVAAGLYTGSGEVLGVAGYWETPAVSSPYRAIANLGSETDILRSVPNDREFTMVFHEEPEPRGLHCDILAEWVLATVFDSSVCPAGRARLIGRAAGERITAKLLAL
jgi:hypothetical protein